jgi:hypothetical protein
VVAYVRLRVANTGRSTANDVRVTLAGVERWTDEAGWEGQRPEIDGATLAWANRHGEPSLDIPSRSDRPLDLLKIVRNLEAQGEIPIKLMTSSVVDALLPGELESGGWRVRFEASADNAPARKYYIAFRFDGSWPGQLEQAAEVWRAVAVEGPSTHPQARPPRPELRDPEEMLAEAIEREPD